jgi:hypothetical protein
LWAGEECRFHGRLEGLECLEDAMLTIVFISIMVALLVLVGVFALLAKDKKRQGQSGSPDVAGNARQGRASGLD